MRKNAIIALADGTVFKGYSLGAEGETIGEVVFNTSMAGYQEILTDPSYEGQIVTLTYPLIGNYGTNEIDCESLRTYLKGFIIKESSVYPSNWRSRWDLETFLKRYGIVGIQGIDTRALTKHIRDFGAQEGVISTIDTNPESLINKAKASPGMVGKDLVKHVTCEKMYEWEQESTEAEFKEGEKSALGGQLDIFQKPQKAYSRSFHVVVYDCGVKYNIIRKLVNCGCKVTIVPANTKADEVLAMKPDGVLLSNGPGDPEAVSYMIENTRQLLGKKPVFGICLGQQIMGLSLGYKTYKLKFGHHGANQPVMDLTTRKVEITAQNHGFAVDADSRKGNAFGRVEITHINLNDKSVEGIECKDIPAFGIQYHPEASPGPHDAGYLFERFIALMEAEKS
ncbi:MAG: glutamine-hydrolyzing carbamoyl-phosphate synthase small subunit [Planctomycetes bacterium]|nr:glutamine-hydrolyzing carbamoyl-phosphate synthase small subunit [Planctomycetota bacterium]